MANLQAACVPHSSSNAIASSPARARAQQPRAAKSARGAPDFGRFLAGIPERPRKNMDMAGLGAVVCRIEPPFPVVELRLVIARRLRTVALTHRSAGAFPPNVCQPAWGP